MDFYPVDDALGFNTLKDPFLTTFYSLLYYSKLSSIMLFFF